MGRRTGWIDVESAKPLVIAAIGQGRTVKEAMLAVRPGSKDPVKIYDNWRSADPSFKAQIERVREVRTMAPEARQAGVGEFEDFRLKYLGMPTYRHQRAWIDVLEGREPDIYHSAVKYEKAQPNRLLINTPPNHAKSMTISIDYVTYRVMKNPNIRVIIVSKTATMAKQFLYAIKSRLTHPKYLDMQLAFGPADGFKASADQWTAQQIYLGGESRDSGEKDPTVQVLGIGGQIYGARADLVILDDCVVLGNSAEWEKQMTWLNIEVASRLGPAGKLLVVGTRVAPVDLYQQLLNGDHYVSGKSPWTHLSQPAVLDYGEGGPESWTTLWPKASIPFEGYEDETPDENGEYRRWDGEHLSTVREQVGPRIWSMVYQQQDVSEDAIFHPVCVRGSVQGMRKPGPLKNAVGHPLHSEGFHVICGLDPAMAGDTAAVAMAVDRATGKRYVLDCEVISAPTPDRIRRLVMGWTDTYKPAQWVIESNAFQLYLVHDEDLNQYLNARGAVIKPHYTSRVNKWSDDFGVAAMAPLFGNLVQSEHENRIPIHDGNNLIELPGANPGIKLLMEQLISWQPSTKNKTDAVMALWFAELAAREVVQQQDTAEQWFGRNRYASPRDLAKRQVIDIQDYQDQRLVANGFRVV